ncbi:MAG TPA: hypothetical protein DGG94_09665 [Micromonosporaceae bacterium]|nr:hypothetical protein [Micromonosporaceae bacterium]
MLPVLLAGASAVVWGAADYCGGAASLHGAASLRQRALKVALLAHVSAIPMIVPFLFVVPGQFSGAALLWGALAGTASLVGMVALNLALASGAMVTVAPVAAVTAALVPLTGGLLMGERPALAALIGAVAAIGAIVMVSRGTDGKGKAIPRNVIRLALISGVAFGLFFFLLGQAGKAAGMWPLLADKTASILLGLLILRKFGMTVKSLRANNPVLMLAVLMGVFDAVATALYLLSSHTGQVSIVAPVAALYPASTVVLALIFNKERLRPIQFAGLGLVGVALVLAAA